MSDNLTLPSKEVLCALINRENVGTGSALTPELVTFGVPSQNPGSGARNTDITVTAVNGSGYTGDQTVNYNRLHLGNDIGAAYVASGQDRNLEFPKGDAVKIADLIAEVNARLAINLGPEDYVDADLPAFEGEPNETKQVQIVAKADSLCYNGSITITIKAQDIPLSTVIVNTNLNGLTYAPPV